MARKREYVLADPEKQADVINALVHDLEGLSLKNPWLITVKRLETPISDGQRKLWWVWMEILGDIIGYTKRDMNDAFFGWIDWLEDRSSITELDHEEMHQLMEEVQHAAASMGWHLPSSMDDYYMGLEAMTAERGKSY